MSGDPDGIPPLELTPLARSYAELARMWAARVHTFDHRAGLADVYRRAARLDRPDDVGGTGGPGGTRGGRRYPARVPLVGRIVECGPIVPEQKPGEAFTLPRPPAGEGRHFMLKVSGDSMADAGIADGDWVVVRQGPQPDHGDIVAAVVDGEATVKTFECQNGRIWLRPQNPEYEPIPGEQAAILGRIVSVMRRI